MNRTIKEATVKRFHYDSHEQLRTHLNCSWQPYNFGRRLKTLNGLTPYDTSAKYGLQNQKDSSLIQPIKPRD